MKIELNNNIKNPIFGTIKLKYNDRRCSEDLLNDIIMHKSIINERNRQAIKLYNIFEPYIKNEAVHHARIKYPEEDVVSDIKVKFWEYVNDINNKSTVDELISQIDEYKPYKNIFSNSYADISLDSKIPNTDRLYYVDIITNKNLPAPQSAVEINKFKRILKKEIIKTKMTRNTEKRLKQRGKGLKFHEIANKENVSKTAVVNSVKQGMLQIQNRTDNISKENKQKITDFANVLGITFDKALKIALKYIEVLSMSPDTINSNIETTSKLFKVPKISFLNAILKNPNLLGRKPDSLNANAKLSTELFNITMSDYIKIGLKYPTLLTQRPESLNNNIETSAKLFGITKQEFLKIALKQPTLFHRKPEALNSNVAASAELLGIPKPDFIKIALKHSALFYQKPETIYQNVETSAKLLKISKENFIKSALQRPTLFSRTPESLYSNVKKSAKLLGISVSEFIQIALRQPALFYLKSETINKNIEDSADILNVSKKEMLDSARKLPQLFYLKPETLNLKSKIAHYYIKLKNLSNDLKLLTYISKSEAQLYQEILLYLIYKNNCFDKLTKSQIKEKLPELLNSCKNPLTFIIPNSDFIEKFVKFANDFSINTTGKNIFKFIVK